MNQQMEFLKAAAYHVWIGVKDSTTEGREKSRLPVPLTPLVTDHPTLPPAGTGLTREPQAPRHRPFPDSMLMFPLPLIKGEIRRVEPVSFPYSCSSCSPHKAHSKRNKQCALKDEDTPTTTQEPPRKGLPTALQSTPALRTAGCSHPGKLR